MPLIGYFVDGTTAVQQISRMEDPPAKVTAFLTDFADMAILFDLSQYKYTEYLPLL